ncbi:EF hand [compost metagenome]
MVQVADAGGTRPVNPAAAAITAAANTPAPQAAAAPAAAPETATQPRMSNDSYAGVPETVKIKSGDTLGNLVAKYQVSYDKLKELNPELFKEGKDAQGRKRAADGHWIYPGDVIRLRTESTTPPASSKSTPAASSTTTSSASAASTPTPATTTANGKVVAAAKGAIDDAKLTPATWAKGREMSEQALSQAKEMLKLIPAGDADRKQYEDKVGRLEREIRAVYPAEAGAPATTANTQEAFESASENFNQAVQAYYDAESKPASERKTLQSESRENAIRHFSAAYDSVRGMTSSASKEEARERLEMMEYALTDMGVNASSIALARAEGADAAPADAATTAAKEPSFTERDTNQDGYLSGNELDAKAKSFDADGNQRVTREEWEMGQMAEREVEWKKEFKQADANQDGWLSGSEANQFRSFDANGDFEVTEQEYLDAKRAQVMNGVYDQDYAARDQNQDGYLSGNELDPATRAFDTNQDGKVTREEYMAAKSGATQTQNTSMSALPVGAMPGVAGVAQPQPTAPANPVQAFESASARFNEATTRNDMLAMTTAYQDAAYAIAYMPQGTERDTLAAQLEIMGFTLQQAYAASGTPVAAGGTVAGVTAQPINAGVQVPTAVPGQPVYAAAGAPVMQNPMAYPPQAGIPVQAGIPGQAGYPAPAGYPVAGTVSPQMAAMGQPGVYAPQVMNMPQAAAAAPAAPSTPPEIPRQTYTQVWSSPDYLDKIMGDKTPPGANGSNPSAQGNTPGGNSAAQGTPDAANPNANGQKVNEQAVKEIDAFLQRANADSVRDMLASRPELLYDSIPRQKAAMVHLLVEGRTDAGDRAAIVNILGMASQTEQTDYVLNELDSLYGGSGKGIKRMFEDLDQAAKGAALKAMFSPSLMQYRQYDQAAFDAVVGAMTKDDIKMLMETMGFGVSSAWMNVLSPQARQSMISKLNSGFNLFGLFGGAEKQMVAALQAFTPQVQTNTQPQAPAPLQ